MAEFKIPGWVWLAGGAAALLYWIVKNPQEGEAINQSMGLMPSDINMKLQTLQDQLQNLLRNPTPTPPAPSPIPPAIERTRTTPTSIFTTPLLGIPPALPPTLPPIEPGPVQQPIRIPPMPPIDSQPPPLLSPILTPPAPAIQPARPSFSPNLGPAQIGIIPVISPQRPPTVQGLPSMPTIIPEVGITTRQAPSPIFQQAPAGITPIRR